MLKKVLIYFPKNAKKNAGNTLQKSEVLKNLIVMQLFAVFILFSILAQEKKLLRVNSEKS